MDDIAVSIIVPIYNTENYLRDCLCSIERQTLSSIEVILVNDGSTDNSKNIAEEFCKKNINFKLINRQNGGLSAARNTGLDSAKGEYVYFLDSDDLLTDDAIERLYSKAKKDDLDVLKFVAYTFEDGSLEYKWQRENGYMYFGSYPDIYDGLEFYKRTIDNNDYYPSCCLMITKRLLLEEHGIRFFEGIVHEDDLFCFQLINICLKVGLLHEPLYYRRIRSGSIMQSSDRLDRIRALCLCAEKTDEYIEQHSQLKGPVSNWQMAYYINTMLGHRIKMTRREQYSAEIKDYFNRVRPYIAKYGTSGSKSLALYYYSGYFIYKIFKYLRNSMNKNDI